MYFGTQICLCLLFSPMGGVHGIVTPGGDCLGSICHAPTTQIHIYVMESGSVKQFISKHMFYNKTSHH